MLVSVAAAHAFSMCVSTQAAKQILVEYASGEAEIDEVDLEGAKSSLAYSIIETTASKTDAATKAFAGGCEGKQADYDRWLLGQIGEARHAPHGVLGFEAMRHRSNGFGLWPHSSQQPQQAPKAVGSFD
eukprot:6174924-Pleurochrysis_carterae.AAC.1